MSVADEAKKCVAFLATANATGGDVILGCTAFIVSVPISEKSDKVALYVVTVRHHSDKLKGKKFGVRLNTKAGDAATIWFNEDHRWHLHPSEPDEVDAAALCLGNDDLSAFDFLHIPRSMFLTDELIKNAAIGAGDNVFMTGLFTRLKGKRNTPIVRAGNIAAMPKERVTTSLCGKLVESEAYLTEMRSMGGISGSPVFARETIVTYDTRASQWGKNSQIPLFHVGPLYLLGLMHGQWTIRPEEQNKSDFRQSKPHEDESIALGIAVVVPAKKILEILDQPELIEQRKELDRLERESLGGTSCI